MNEIDIKMVPIMPIGVRTNKKMISRSKEEPIFDKKISLMID